MDLFIQILSLLVAYGVGLGCGSYATMPYYRLPRGEACAGRWIGPKSRCPSCETILRTRDLLPVFNWLITGGKCHSCKTPVNPMYFFIEFTISMLSVALFLRYGFDQLYILTLILMVCLVILVAIDLDGFKLPDAVLVVILADGLVFRALQDGQIYTMVNSFVMAILFTVGYAKYREQKDEKPFPRYDYLKLIALGGVWLSHLSFLMMLVFIGIFMLLSIGVVQLIRPRTKLPLTLPIAGAFLSAVLYPDLPRAILTSVFGS